MSTAELVQASTALPEQVVKRGISESQWRTLFNLFPGGKPNSVLLVWDYCVSRKLDPLKKPCHIVEMDIKVNGQWQKRDVVMPGIYEYRITAHRTGLYLGHSLPEYGDEMEFAGVSAPAWCAMTMYRWNEKAREKVPFPVKVYFAEVVATNRDGKANSRWSKAPIQMLTKCTEAAGLRETFPEEFGGEATAEEMEGRVLAVDEEPAKSPIHSPQRRTASAVSATEPETPAASAEIDGDVIEGDATAEQSTAPVDAPAYIGTIAELTEKDGGALVQLNTGFTAATKNAAFITALKRLREEKVVIELGTEESKRDPKKYAPTIVDITPIRDGQEG